MNLKDILFFILNIITAGLKNRASILMYHSVGDSKVFFTVNIDSFEKQLQYIKKHDYTVLKLSEFVRRIEEKEDISNCIIVTFDDGYEDNYTNVFPLLKKYNISATIFLITNKIGEQNKIHSGEKWNMLDKTKIKEMYESGLVEFMPHTVSHVKLSDVSDEVAEYEIGQSQRDINELFNVKANIFSYPYGLFNSQHVKMLKKNGWRGAVTVKEGLVNKDSDIFQLPRNSIDSSTSMTQFKGKVSGTIALYRKFRK